MKGKNKYIVAANVFAILLLAMGLLSPLTPSEGNPTIIELFIFAILPLLILGGIIIKTENRLLKLIAAGQLVIVTIILYNVLGLVYGTAK
jgi:hypothetical protein